MTITFPSKGDKLVADQPVSDPAPQRSTPKVEVSPVANPPEWVQALLKYTNQYCDADRRNQIIRAVYDATGGSDIGLALAEEWYRRREDFPGSDRLAAIWRGFSPSDANVDGFAILCRGVLADGFDPLDICESCEPQFDVGESAPEQEESPISSATSATPFDRYSLTSRREEVSRTAVEQALVLGRLALAGQLTAYFGQPGIGKTAIMMALVGGACEAGHIDPSKCYYLDFDTDSAGLLEKIDYASERGFHVLSDGYLDFSNRKFLVELDVLIERNQAVGVTIILDTVKQHVSMMDKDRLAGFSTRLRRFSKAGGTCIVLAHVNKNPGPDGKPIHAGTTDLVEQFDACYILSEVGVDSPTQTRTVLFESFKSRGHVARRAMYRYSIAEGLSYRDLLDSVVEVEEAQLSEMQRAVQTRSDATLIDAVIGCITAGVVAKMELVAAAAQRSGATRRVVLTVLDRYTGSDPQRHHWTFDVQARGAKVYRLLRPGSAAPAVDGATTSTPRESGHE